MRTIGDAFQEVKARIPTSRLLKAPREVNRESVGHTLVDNTGLVLEVFHADSPASERQWAAFLRHAAKDMRWLCDELEAAWRRDKRQRQERRVKAGDPLSTLLAKPPTTESERPSRQDAG